MEDWVKSYELKPFKIIDVNPGIEFNVIESLELPSLKDADIFYSYIILNTSFSEYDATLELKGEFPKYYFPKGLNVLESSVIKVLLIAKEY